MIDPAADAPYSSLFDFIEGAERFPAGKNQGSGEGRHSPSRGDRGALGHAWLPRRRTSEGPCHHSFSPLHPRHAEEAGLERRSILSNGPYYLPRADPRADRPSAETSCMGRQERGHFPGSSSGSATSRQRRRPCTTRPGAMLRGTSTWCLKDKRGVSVNAMFATHYLLSVAQRYASVETTAACGGLSSLSLPWQEIRKTTWLPARPWSIRSRAIPSSRHRRGQRRGGAQSS
jgi:peptide/nickel transport system substrate-binding protein/oligopeptide transport system substrate-binding protein